MHSTQVSLFFTAVRAYVFNSAGAKVVARLRVLLFGRMLAQETAWFDARETGDLLCGNQPVCRVHAIEQASRRWRGGRRDDSAQGRQDILIYAQAMSDWLMTFISVVSLVFLFSVKKLRDDLRKELRGHAATGVFLFLLFAATVVLSVSAMRKLSKRVVTESTDLFDHEV